MTRTYPGRSAGTSSRTVLHPSWALLPGGDVSTDVSVVVEGGVITDLRATSSARHIDAEHIDLPGQLLMPGLINLHTHVGAGPIGRAISEDVELPEGMPFYVPLSRLWRHAYSDRLREQYRAIVRWDALSFLRSGTTTVLNHASVDIEGYLEMALELGLRSFAGPALPLDVTHRLGTIKSGRGTREDSTGRTAQAAELGACRELFEQWHGKGGLVDIVLGPAAVHAVDIEVLKGVAELSEELDCLVTTHLCQSIGEMDDIAARFDATPLRMLEKIGLANSRLIAAHGTYLPESDFALAAESGLTIAHCASRKAKEALVSPSVAFSRHGIRVGLGSDGFNSDMVEELKLAAVLAKIGSGRADSPTSREVIAMATETNAQALRRPDLGVLEVGATADLIAIDMGQPMTAPVFDPVQALVFYGDGRDVTMTMIGGDAIMRDRNIAGVDLDAARDAASSAAEQIWEEAVEAGLLKEVLASPTAPRRPKVWHD